MSTTLWVYDYNRAVVDDSYRRLVAEWARQEGLPVDDIVSDPPLQVIRGDDGYRARGVEMVRDEKGRAQIRPGREYEIMTRPNAWLVFTYPAWLS